MARRWRDRLLVAGQHRVSVLGSSIPAGWLLLTAAVYVAGLVGAFIANVNSALVNVLTDVSGIALGTFLTVAIIDGNAKRRDTNDRVKRRRSRLKLEATENLARLSTRLRSSACLLHHYVRRDAKEYSPDSLQNNEIYLDPILARRLLLWVFQIHKLRVLSHEAVSEAIRDEWAAELVSDTQRTAAMHQHFVETRRLVAAITNLATPTGQDNWLDTLWSLLLPASQQKRGATVPNVALGIALGAYDLVSELCDRNVALTRFLVGEVSELPTVRPRPVTPFGDDEAQRIRAEQIDASEVELLIRNNRYPFGDTWPADLYGTTPEEQAAALTEMAKNILSQVREQASTLGYDLSGVTIDVAQIAEDLAETLSPPEEGIEVRKAPPRVRHS